MVTAEQKKRFAAIKESRTRIRRAGRAALPFVADIPAAVNELAPLIPVWAPGAYAPGDVRLHLAIPYKCVQGHDSTANPGWTPDATPALWMQYHGTSIETARPYIQPLGAHDAYQIDEYIVDGGKVYRCKVAATVYPPSTLPANWEAMAGEPTEPGEPTDPDPEPVNEWPDWTPGTYAKNAQVTRNGKRYISQVDGNHWEPGAAGVYDNIWKLVP